MQIIVILMQLAKNLNATVVRNQEMLGITFVGVIVFAVADVLHEAHMYQFFCFIWNYFYIVSSTYTLYNPTRSMQVQFIFSTVFCGQFKTLNLKSTSSNYRFTVRTKYGTHCCSVTLFSNKVRRALSRVAVLIETASELKNMYSICCHLLGWGILSVKLVVLHVRER